MILLFTYDKRNVCCLDCNAQFIIPIQCFSMDSNGKILILSVLGKKKVDDITLGSREIWMAGHISKIKSLHKGLHISSNFIPQQFLGAHLHIKAGI